MIYNDTIKSYIINTKERRNRKIKSEKQLKRRNLTSNFYIQPLDSKPIEGNKKSHLGLIKKCIEDGLDKVLIMEDVITTGKSSLECSKLVLSNKGSIVGYACIIDRSKGKSEIKDKIVSQVELEIPTFSKNDLPKELSSIDPVKPGSRNL